MQYPLIDRGLLTDLRLVHAAFNFVVMLLFYYQAWLGLSMRYARKKGLSLPFPHIRRHRSMGPVLAILGALGYFSGITLILLDTGRLLTYPFHLFFGSALVVILVTTSLVSRMIKGPDSPFRTPHFLLGIAILLLYLIEVFLGIGILL